jgi:3-dehydroquinate dehydratase
MTPIEKTTKADILNYLRETQTMQFNTRASIVVVSFSGRCDVLRIELYPFIGCKITFALFQKKPKAYNDQVMADFKDKWLYYEWSNI